MIGKLTIVTACVAVGPVAALRSLAVEPVTVVEKSAIPDARQPQVAVDPAGKVYLVLGPRTRSDCAISDDGGKSYRQPSKIADAGVMSLGMRRGPRIAASEKSSCRRRSRRRARAWPRWRSADLAFEGRRQVMERGGAMSTASGFRARRLAPSGRFARRHVLLRMARPARAKDAALGAASNDGGATWHERLIYKSPDGPVCQCCQPQATFDAGKVARDVAELPCRQSRHVSRQLEE